MRLVARTTIQGLEAAGEFRFGHGTVAGDRYYLPNQTSASLDVFDAATSQQVGRITGSGELAFTGVVPDTTTFFDTASRAGPNSVTAVGHLLFVTDVDSVKVVDPLQQRVLETIALGTAGRRADTACLDAARGLLLVASPESSPPRLSLIDTNDRSLHASVTLPDVAVPGRTAFGGGAAFDRTTRIGQCRYDPVADRFYLPRVVTPNYDMFGEHGELLVLPGAALRALARGDSKELDTLPATISRLAACLPTGLALGPPPAIGIGCRGATGPTGHGGDARVASVVVIVDRSSGAELQRIVAGAGDQLEYHAGTRRYYNAAYAWEATGRDIGCGSTVLPCTPSLFAIDAYGSSAWPDWQLADLQLHTGKNAHSVAIDPVRGKAFVPVAPGSAAGSCTFCGDEPASLLTFALGSGGALPLAGR